MACLQSHDKDIEQFELPPMTYEKRVKVYVANLYTSMEE